ncbi:MAG: hypothetical protein ABL869_01465 [Candidatus Nitrotoga sp.]
MGGAADKRYSLGLKMLGNITRGDTVAKGVGLKPEEASDTFFLSEIEAQCEFAHRSFGQMLELAAEQPQNKSLFALSHMILVFGGNVAKILNPSRDAPSASRRRATRLKSTIDLENLNFESVRRARNYVEHFDERMHKYLLLPPEDGVRCVTILRMIQDHEPDQVTVEGKGAEPYNTKFLQLLNTSIWQLNFFGERFDLKQIVELLDLVKNRVRNAKSKEINVK